jgi:hypothetical protein
LSNPADCRFYIVVGHDPAFLNVPQRAGAAIKPKEEEYFASEDVILLALIRKEDTAKSRAMRYLM